MRLVPAFALVFLVASAIAIDAAKLSPFWLLFPVAILLAAIGAWWTSPTPERDSARPASRKDPALRPIARLSGNDPLDSIFGAQADLLPNPDQGFEDAHHLVIDPKELGAPDGEP